MNDQDIIEKLKNGDDEIFKKVYLTYQTEFVHWLCGKYRLNAHQSTEIYQGAVVRMYDNVVTGKLTTLTSNLKTYLFAIGKNMALEHNRKQKKARILPNILAQHLEDDGVSLDPLFEIMYHALNHLGEPCKTVIEKHYFSGLSSDELAREMGYKNANTAKTKKFKCLQKLIKLAHDRKRIHSTQ